MTLHLEIRSYPTESAHHQHDHAQVVLPISGGMDIEVEGRGGLIDHSRAALVAPGSVHAQQTHAHSRFLVLDCAPAALQGFALQTLAQRIHVPIAPATRRLIEYAELIGVPLAQLDHRVFAANPLAVRISEQYYVRSIQRVNEDLSLTFYCAVENGIVLTAMAPGPLLPNLHNVFDGLHRRLGPLLLTIGCDCFLRRLELEAQGCLAQVGGFLREQRVMGFNTYGEQFNGMHINQTFTGVAIARNRPPVSR